MEFVGARHLTFERIEPHHISNTLSSVLKLVHLLLLEECWMKMLHQGTTVE